MVSSTSRKRDFTVIFSSQIPFSVSAPVSTSIVAVLYNRTNGAAIDADSCATHIISDRTRQIGDCCGDLLWPTETAYVIGCHVLRNVAFDFLPCLAPAVSLAHMGERCPSLFRKDRAGRYDV